MDAFLTGILGYLLGSIPSGLIIGRTFWNVDLRERGSKNIGATNAYRTLGKSAGALIFAADLAKGILAVWLGQYLAGTPAAMMIGGMFAIIGHNWSILLKFSGGKGVATGLGVISMLMPQVTLTVFLIWIAIVYFTKYVSLGSVTAAALVPILAYLYAAPAEYAAFGALAAVFVIYRHKSNIARLLNGTESKIKAGRIQR